MSTPKQRAEWSAYRQLQKERAIAAERCTRCHKRHPEPGRRMCSLCAADARLRNEAKRSKAAAAGLCIRCVSAPAIGVFCKPCLTKHNYYGQARRERAKIDGVCVSCFHNSPAPGLFSCRACIERISAGNKARKLARKERSK